MNEKTEKATPYKLQKAKEKGQVSKSVELTTCLSFLVMLALMFALWRQPYQEIKALLKRLLISAPHFQFTLDTITQLHQWIWFKCLVLWAPLACGGVLSIILATMAQTGIVWSITPLKPDFKRLHLMQGIKKLCSLKNSFEAVKSLIKLCIMILVLWILIKQQLPNILSLLFTKPSLQPEYMMHFLLKTLFQLLLFLSALAFIDRLYTQRSFNKSQRMSKHEIKEEYKHREGDPQIKQKIKQIQRQLQKKITALAAVKSADVLLTNPTHYAIALYYDKQTMPAPKVVYKAQGARVQEVKKLAKKHGVPIIEDAFLTRLLYHNIELNHWVSEAFFSKTASIYNDLYKNQGTRHDH